jgi:hypothetical protein
VGLPAPWPARDSTRTSRGLGPTTLAWDGCMPEAVTCHHAIRGGAFQGCAKRNKIDHYQSRFDCRSLRRGLPSDGDGCCTTGCPAHLAAFWQRRQDPCAVGAWSVHVAVKSVPQRTFDRLGSKAAKAPAGVEGGRVPDDPGATRSRPDLQAKLPWRRGVPQGRIAISGRSPK